MDGTGGVLVSVGASRAASVRSASASTSWPSAMFAAPRRYRALKLPGSASWVSTTVQSSTTDAKRARASPGSSGAEPLPPGTAAAAVVPCLREQAARFSRHSFVRFWASVTAAAGAPAASAKTASVMRMTSL